jgi:hypothetical protein
MRTSVALLVAGVVHAPVYGPVYGPLYAQGIVNQLPPETGIQLAAGQNVQPFYEGWQRYPDGSISMWFGYLNRNFKEQVDVPIGPNNAFDPGGDRGQPTRFYPRRQQFVFKIDLPKDWDKDKKLVWTVTAHGRSSSATGWMQPEWEVDDGVRQMNVSLGATPPVDPPNAAPSITGSPDQAIEFGKSLHLTASATDDGLPKPRGPRAMGLWIRWILYRGPGDVTFDPDRTKPVAGKSVELSTEVTFSVPGMYWLRAIASDGMLESNHDVRVAVESKR